MRTLLPADEHSEFDSLVTAELDASRRNVLDLEREVRELLWAPVSPRNHCRHAPQPPGNAVLVQCRIG
jgi:hypothetical protein